MTWPGWWQPAVAVLAGLGLVWLLLVATIALGARGADRLSWREAARLVPDVVRLVSRLAHDHDLSRGVRWRLWLLLGYLLLPVDLVPDFLPVIGYADDAIVIALVLRSVARTAGPAALDRHWPGTADGLATLHRLVGTGRVT